jgi:DNA cross-link repair 1A protein
LDKDKKPIPGYIYTSVISRKIFLLRFPYLEPYVIGLELLKKYMIKGREVVLIPANHCPGAVMFLFISPKGVVLSTGDFRYRSTLVPLIRNFTSKISSVHLDNTFATKEESFPS